ncbi:MAG: 50S ribosomal protein L15 [Crenarchaeota archaeon]|nr:50S ribosomal protein L15 [Thermoproteota archaeon]
MPHKLRKTRKHRGSRTQGWGRIGQHRDAGSRPYRLVGRHKHKGSLVQNIDPDYFGKHGFRSPKALHTIVNALNICKLTEIAQAQNTTTIDLTTMGYTKLLGTGKVTQALTVTVPACSAAAAKKIEAAGGKVITDEEEVATAESGESQ